MFIGNRGASYFLHLSSHAENVVKTWKMWGQFFAVQNAGVFGGPEKKLLWYSKNNCNRNNFPCREMHGCLHPHTHTPTVCRLYTFEQLFRSCYEKNTYLNFSVLPWCSISTWVHVLKPNTWEKKLFNKWNGRKWIINSLLKNIIAISLPPIPWLLVYRNVFSLRHPFFSSKPCQGIHLSCSGINHLIWFIFFDYLETT